MMRIREFLTLSFLALSAAAALGQDGGSHVRIPDWNRGGLGPARAKEMAEQLKAAGINPPTNQMEPETIKRLLDMFKGSRGANPEDLPPDLIDRIRNDKDLSRQLRNFDPNNEDLRQQLRQRDPKADPEKWKELFNKAKERIA